MAACFSATLPKHSNANFPPPDNDPSPLVTPSTPWVVRVLLSRVKTECLPILLMGQIGSSEFLWKKLKNLMYMKLLPKYTYMYMPPLIFLYMAHAQCYANH